MKKLIACLLTAILVSACLGTLAEPAEEDVFVFREGVRFGMTPEEVIALEGREPEYTDDGEDMGTDHWQSIAWNRVRVSKFDAYLSYAFYCGEFRASVYLFSYLDEASVDYLHSAVASVYGDPAERDEDCWQGFIRSIIPADQVDEYLDADRDEWRAPGNARVVMLLMEGYTCLMYYDGNIDYADAALPGYDTTGL